MTGALVGRALLSHIPHTQFLVTRGGDEHGSACIPRETLDNVRVLESERGGAGVNIPQLDGQVARCGGQDVIGRRIKEYLANFSGVTSKLGNGAHIGGLLGVGEKGEVLGHLPDHDLAIIGGGSNNTVVERVPVGIGDDGRVATEEGDLIGDLAALGQGDDGKSTTTAGLPVDGKELWVRLREVDGGRVSHGGQLACAGAGAW